MKGKVLAIDDDRNMCELLQAGLGKKGYEVEWTTEPATGIDKAREGDHDVVLTDLRLGAEIDGLGVCERIVESRPEMPVVVMTAFGSMDTAIGAIRVGAYDFVTKPVDVKALELVLDRAVRHRRLSDEVERLRKEVGESRRPGPMIGESAAMKNALEMIRRVADSDASVLIAGESGSGKELAARALHDGSERREGPFVAVNCAAMPSQLLESELFGHVKGAFTDAHKGREGLFVKANGGTLLLDEIGEMGADVQPKLLRVLQEHTVRPVGSNAETPTDVRIVAATNRDLEQDVEDGRFREDLYYRINVVTLTMPPLRKRGSDVLLLAQHFLEQHAEQQNRHVRSISQPAAERLLAYDWPGNVRELENSMERAVLLARFEDVRVDDLPDKVRNHRSSRVMIDTQDPDDLVSLETLERRYIRRVLDTVEGNKTQAARVLGVDRSTLYRKLERYEEERATDDGSG